VANKATALATGALAVLGGGYGHLLVEPSGKANDYRVDVVAGKHFFVIRGPLRCSCCLLHRTGARFVDVDDYLQLRPLNVGAACCMGTPDGSCTDESYAQRFPGHFEHLFPLDLRSVDTGRCSCYAYFAY